MENEKKSRYSEAQKKATIKYMKTHYKRIPLDVPIEFYDALKKHADAAGESVNRYIKRAIIERSDRDDKNRDTGDDFP